MEEKYETIEEQEPKKKLQEVRLEDDEVNGGQETSDTQNETNEGTSPGGLFGKNTKSQVNRNSNNSTHMEDEDLENNNEDEGFEDNNEEEFEEDDSSEGNIDEEDNEEDEGFEDNNEEDDSDEDDIDKQSKIRQNANNNPNKIEGIEYVPNFSEDSEDINEVSDKKYRDDSNEFKREYTEDQEIKEPEGEKDENLLNRAFNNASNMVSNPIRKAGDKISNFKENFSTKLDLIKNTTLKLLTPLASLIMNPMTWVVILALIVINTSVAFFTNVGKSDWNIECGTNGAANVSVGTDVSDDTRQQVIASWLTNTPFAFLDGEPMSKEQAAGVIGNAIKESAGGRPHYVEGDSLTNDNFFESCDNTCVLEWGDKSNKAIGFLQWDGSRREKLVKFAIERDEDWYNLNTQLQFLKEELDGSMGNSLKKQGFNDRTKTAGDYALLWNKYFEISADNQQQQESRAKAAEDFLVNFNGGGSAFAINCVGGDMGAMMFGPIPADLSHFNNVTISPPLDKSMYNVGDGWGPYSPKGKVEDHTGLDLVPKDGKEGHALYAMMDGTVEGLGYSGVLGNWIQVKSADNPVVSFRILHMQSPTHLTLGRVVMRGDVIGALGNTGYSTGAHVHIDIFVNGEKFPVELTYPF